MRTTTLTKGRADVVQRREVNWVQSVLRDVDVGPFEQRIRTKGGVDIEGRWYRALRNTQKVVGTNIRELHHLDLFLVR